MNLKNNALLRIHIEFIYLANITYQRNITNLFIQRDTMTFE